MPGAWVYLFDVSINVARHQECLREFTCRSWMALVYWFRSPVSTLDKHHVSSPIRNRPVLPCLCRGVSPGQSISFQTIANTITTSIPNGTGIFTVFVRSPLRRHCRFSRRRHGANGLLHRAAVQCPFVH